MFYRVISYAHGYKTSRVHVPHRDGHVLIAAHLMWQKNGVLVPYRKFETPRNFDRGMNVNSPVWTAEQDPAATVNVHNKYRAMHGAQPLTWGADLANFAANWVRGIHSLKTCQRQYEQFSWADMHQHVVS
jgi:hypothetical protein